MKYCTLNWPIIALVLAKRYDKLLLHCQPIFLRCCQDYKCASNLTLVHKIIWSHWYIEYNNNNNNNNNNNLLVV